MPYINNSMSENANFAYNDGQMPLSKWTKLEIVEEIKKTLANKELLPLFEKLPLKALKSQFLEWSSWHHTSGFYNKTSFYQLDYEKVKKATAESLEELYKDYKNEKVEKQPKKEPGYITALVQYVEWTGPRKHLKRVEHEEIVYFREGEKMIKTCTGNKRLSSLTILKQITQEKEYKKVYI